MGLAVPLGICTRVMLVVQAGPQSAGVDLGPDGTQEVEALAQLRTIVAKRIQ